MKMLESAIYALFVALLPLQNKPLVYDLPVEIQQRVVLATKNA
jgi:hypothetical protein